jgi:hypothetical protein
MSCWNHRVVKETLPNGEDWYTVREVYYNADGTIYAYTQEAVGISGYTIEELREYTQWVLAALDKPVLVDGEVQFVDYSEEPTCTCPPECELVTCHGACGCEYHDALYNDFLAAD